MLGEVHTIGTNNIYVLIHIPVSQATPPFGPKSGRVRLSSADRPTCPISNRIRAELGFNIRAEFLKL